MNNRVGEINYNNFGSKMEIIVYRNANDIIIEFQDKYKDLIPQKLYEAMYKYEVEIND